MRRLLDFRSKNSKAKALAEHAVSLPLVELAATATGAQGLQVLCEGTDPFIDIVAVHGLNGYREMTWTSSNGVDWLRDLLKHDLPNARILSWGYTRTRIAALA